MLQVSLATLQQSTYSRCPFKIPSSTADCSLAGSQVVQLCGVCKGNDLSTEEVA